MARILIAEDYTDIRKVLGLILTPYGHEIIEAGDGREAIKLAQEHRPDLILMDMSMPVLSGWDATRQLKANPATAAIPIIALTAHAMRGDRERAWEAGCDGFITKPIDDELLEHTIQQILDEKQGDEPEDAGPDTASAAESRRPSRAKTVTIHNQHVLIVEDDPKGAEVIEKSLKEGGYRTSVVEAASQAAALLEGEAPDLIICSTAPEGAYELTRRIKKGSQLPFIPVMLVSAGEIGWEKGLEAGADDFIAKPINSTELTVRVRSMIRLKLAIAAEANRADELASVISQMATGVIIIDGDGVISLVNGRGLEIMHVSLDEVIGSTIDELVARFELSHPDCTAMGPAEFPLKRALDRGETISKQMVCMRARNGRQIILQVNAGPIYDERGRKIGAASVFEELPEELLDAREKVKPEIR
jgi:PAS domain S-box-containing protein